MDSNRDKAFLFAIMSGYLTAVNHLIKLTTDPTKRNEMIHQFNDEPLRTAMRKGDLEVVSRLIELHS